MELFGSVEAAWQFGEGWGGGGKEGDGDDGIFDSGGEEDMAVEKVGGWGGGEDELAVVKLIAISEKKYHLNILFVKL